jgi:hypothetical protein
LKLLHLRRNTSHHWHLHAASEGIHVHHWIELLLLLLLLKKLLALSASCHPWIGLL